MDNPYLQSQFGLFGAGLLPMPRDTRPIKRRWQREKSVKIMKSLKREGAISSLCEPFLIFPDIDFGRDPASVKMRIFSDAGRRIEARMGVLRPRVRAGNRNVRLPLTRLKPSHISAGPKSMAIARFLQRFGP